MDLQAIVVQGVRKVLAEYDLQLSPPKQQVQVHKELMDMVYEMSDAGQFKLCHTHRDEGYSRKWVIVSLILYNNGAELKLASNSVAGEFRDAYPLAVRDLYEKYQTAKRIYNR